MEIYELDPFDFDDHVTDVEYGDIDTRITCSDSWNCSGTSSWHSGSASDATGVSADVRVKVKTAFSW